MQAAAEDAARKCAALADCLHCGAPALHPGPPEASTACTQTAMQRRSVCLLRAPEAPQGLSSHALAEFGAAGALACLGEAAVMLARLGLASRAALRPLAEQAAAIRAAVTRALAHGGQQPGGGQGEAGGAGISGSVLPSTERVLETALARGAPLNEPAGSAHVAHAGPYSGLGCGTGARELLGLLLEEEAAALAAAASAGVMPAADAARAAAATLGRLLDPSLEPLGTLYSPAEPKQARSRARALALRARCIGAFGAAWPAQSPAVGDGPGLGTYMARILEPADQAAVRDLAEAAGLLEANAVSDGAARGSAGAAPKARAGECAIIRSLESGAARAELTLAIAAAIQRRTLAAGRGSEPPVEPASRGCCSRESPGASTAMDCSPERCGGRASHQSSAASPRTVARDCPASKDADTGAADAAAAWDAAAEQAGRALAHWEAALTAAASGRPSAGTAEHGLDGDRSLAGGAASPGHMEGSRASWDDGGGEAAGGRLGAGPAAAAQAAVELAMMLGLQGRDEAAARAMEAARSLSGMQSQGAGQPCAACALPGGVPADEASVMSAARGRAVLDTIVCPYPGPCLDGGSSQGLEVEAVRLRAEAAAAAVDAPRGAAALLRRAALHRAAAESARRAGAPGWPVHAWLRSECCFECVTWASSAV